MTRPATDTEVLTIIDGFRAADSFARVRAWSRGELPAADPKAVQARLRQLIERASTDPSSLTAAAPFLNPHTMERARELTGGHPVETFQAITRLALGTDDLTVVLDSLDDYFDKLRPHLVHLVPTLVPRMVALVESTDARALAQSFELDLNDGQAELLRPLVEEQQQATLNGVRHFCELLKSDRPLDVMTLIDALLADLSDAGETHTDLRARVAG